MGTVPPSHPRQRPLPARLVLRRRRKRTGPGGAGARLGRPGTARDRPVPDRKQRTRSTAADAPARVLRGRFPPRRRFNRSGPRRKMRPWKKSLHPNNAGYSKRLQFARSDYLANSTWARSIHTLPTVSSLSIFSSRRSESSESQTKARLKVLCGWRVRSFSHGLQPERALDRGIFFPRLRDRLFRDDFHLGVVGLRGGIAHDSHGVADLERILRTKSSALLQIEDRREFEPLGLARILILRLAARGCGSRLWSRRERRRGAGLVFVSFVLDQAHGLEGPRAGE